VLGAIFSGRLTAELSSKLPSGAAEGAVGAVNPARLAALPRPVHDAYISSFTDALHVVFLVATAVVLVAFLLTWMIPEKPLRATVETAEGLGEAFGAPVDTDSLREVTRGLTRLVGRERTLEFIDGATARAGVDLSPGAAWLLLRGGAADAPDDLAELRSRPNVDRERFDAALAELQERDCTRDGQLTTRGHAVRDQLVSARTDCLRQLVEDWEPERHPELDSLVRRLAEELAPPPRDDRGAADAAAA
jgi:hypothetical protein